MPEKIPEKSRFTNRLINEKSIYLIQHAHNPVDWYPWGEEAFEAAKERGVPIFLSIGYATCHWCHVMEKESFENEEIANLMNDAFVNIKVDREELPEIDNIYMEFAQSMMAGAAGWPLNLLLTPDLQPFFATTYLPAKSKNGMMGLNDLIQKIKEIWESEEREKVLEQASQIVELFADHLHNKGDQLPESEKVEDVAELLFQLADPVYGGMRGVPKFPIGYQVNFMLRYSAQMKDSRALFLVERNLDMMHRGGIYDHLGGGFSRYSVDQRWLVPHFEKMLYDNALLANSYLEAWQFTKKAQYREICEEILHYILRDMTDREGGFYSAEDADSEGHEGWFYTWPYSEVIKLLGDSDGPLFCEFYDITPQGNFEGRNILHTPLTLEEFCSRRELDQKSFGEQLKRQRKILWEAREKREHPLKDDKILCSWNGLMIYAFAKAGAAFENPIYLGAAEHAARFIKAKMWNGKQLFHLWRNGEAVHHGGLDDYAFLIRALITLFEVRLGTEWLQWAVELADILSIQFKSDEGAFYQTDGQDASVILRKCQFSDGAEPSGNAIHCENLIRLYQMTWDEDYLEQAKDILKAVKEYIDNYALGYCYHAMSLQRYYDRRSATLVVALDKKQQWENEIQRQIFENFKPNLNLIWKLENDKELNKICHFVKNQVPLEKGTTLYICRKGVCEKPVADPKEFAEVIGEL